MREPVVSIIVPAHNEEDYIGACLTSLTDQDFAYPYEIIVVDNNSTDQTAKIIKSFPTVKYLFNPIPGVAKTRNLGFSAAQSPILASTDADCTHPQDWLKNIYTTLKTNPKLVAIGGYALLIDDPVNRIATKIGHKIRILKISYLLFGAQALTTQNLALYKSAWEAVGGFDENIVSPIVLDDADLTLRLGEIGLVKSFRHLYVYASSRRVKKQYGSYLLSRFRSYAHYVPNWQKVIARKLKKLPLPKLQSNHA